jgi:Ca2+-binding RTX toxin-like protein
MAKFNLSVEQLETREVPAVTAFVSAGTLIVQGDNQDNNIAVSSLMGNTVVDFDQDGVNDFSTPTAGLTQILVNGDNGDDILSSQPGQMVFTVLLGGNGKDNLVSFTNGVMDGGNGMDDGYNIVSPNVLVNIERPTLSVAATLFRTPNGAEPVIFGQTTAPVQRVGNAVYLLGTPGNDVALINDQQVVYNGQVFALLKTDEVVASVLGAGNDVFAIDPNSKIRGVAYGLSGNDFFLGGRADDLFKGGADADVLLGGDGDDDLAAANGQVDLLAADFLDGGAGRNIFRADANDVIWAMARDIVLGGAKRKTV